MASGAIDKYVLKQPDMKRSLYFGGPVILGEAVSTLSAPIVPNIIPVNLGSAVSGKTLSGRVVEIGLTSGAAWSKNKYVLKNELSRDDWTKRVAVISASSFLGQYLTNYVTGQALSYFK